MRNIDFAPLYRNAIGFDRLFNMVEASAKKSQSGGYPPYNIEQQDELHYRITMLWPVLLKNNSTSPRKKTCW
ncbi:16 kDa heat shock protein A [Photobacterium aphoticum]|uniref:16 kDa heat shock protein A n=1 Tax=Photobacterium aphoticum TaxID=754436 RepID=A0A090QP20_9GAMM|nr:16 kDa heat shock protein A [Photobacterium aphoticum]